MTGEFSDHFSGHAADYSRSRPGYPADLFDWLRDNAPATKRAWDCATGNGQAARELSGRFDLVLATDGSSEQLRSRERDSNACYIVALAEQPPLSARSIDLCTVAQAAHWFDLPAFSAQFARVARPRALLALWCYTLFRVTPEVDAVVDELYGPILGSYWPAGRRHIETEYRDLDLPFEPVTTPAFEMRCRWTLEQTMAYLGTWSSAARYRAATGADPLDLIHGALVAAWGPGSRDLVWPVHLRCFRAS